MLYSENIKLHYKNFLLTLPVLLLSIYNLLMFIKYVDNGVVVS